MMFIYVYNIYVYFLNMKESRFVSAAPQLFPVKKKVFWFKKVP